MEITPIGMENSGVVKNKEEEVDSLKNEITRLKKIIDSGKL